MCTEHQATCQGGRVQSIPPHANMHTGSRLLRWVLQLWTWSGSSLIMLTVIMQASGAYTSQLWTTLTHMHKGRSNVGHMRLPTHLKMKLRMVSSSTEIKLASSAAECLSKKEIFCISRVR